MIKRLRKLWTGYKTLRAWLESGGKLVDSQMAYNRTITCINCPKNKIGDFWDWLARYFADRIPENQRSISPHLWTCQVCGCALRAKVKIPLASILVNQPDNYLDAFPKNCWLVKEVDE